MVFQNNKTRAMLWFQTNPVGVELFSYVNTFICSKICIEAGHVSENAFRGWSLTRALQLHK